MIRTRCQQTFLSALTCLIRLADQPWEPFDGPFTRVVLRHLARAISYETSVFNLGNSENLTLVCSSSFSTSGIRRVSQSQGVGCTHYLFKADAVPCVILPRKACAHPSWHQPDFSQFPPSLAFNSDSLVCPGTYRIMENVSTASVSTQLRSCVGCSDRKVKCDRQRPCSACTKRKIRCISPEVRRPKRSRRGRNDDPKERLMLLEAALRRQGINHSKVLHDILGPDYDKTTPAEPASTDADLQPLTPASVNSEPLRSLTTTQLVRRGDTGRSTFVDK